MLRLAARWPDDDLVAILAAEAVMDSQPWDYWKAGGLVPKARAGEAIRLVETVLARSPENPQAIHLLIHLTEASAHPERAASAAAKLGRIAPAAPHMVHMPSHTWYRIGRFDDAISANKAAIAADEGYAKAVGDDPQFYGYFTHHAHFLASSGTQSGDRATALAAADALEAAILPAAAIKKPYLQSRLVTALHARSRFLTPAEVLALPAPDPRLSRLQIAWRGVRAEALAMAGDPGAARVEVAKLRDQRKQLGGASGNRRGEDTNRSVAELMVDVGLGRKIAVIVAKRLAQLMIERGAKPDAVTLTLGRYGSDDGVSTQGMVFVDGSEGASVQFAPCCRPIPGDQIVGYLGRGEGLLVHTTDCHTGKRLFERDSERWIQVEWADEMTRPFEAEIIALAHNGKGVLAQVAAAISSAEADITHLDMGDTSASETIELRLLLGVRDRQHLADVLRTLRRSPAVLRCWRVKP
jgi:hypothetical protein